MKTTTKYRTPLFFGFSTCGVPNNFKEKGTIHLKRIDSKEWNTKATIYNQ